MASGKTSSWHLDGKTKRGQIAANEQKKISPYQWRKTKYALLTQKINNPLTENVVGKNQYFGWSVYVLSSCVIVQTTKLITWETLKYKVINDTKLT